MIPKVINTTKMRTAKIYENLNQARENQKKSWEVLSVEIGMSRMGLYKTFTKKVMTLDTMIAVCEALNVDPAEIVGGSFQPKETKASVKDCTTDIRALCDQIDTLSRAAK